MERTAGPPHSIHEITATRAQPSRHQSLVKDRLSHGVCSNIIIIWWNLLNIYGHPSNNLLEKWRNRGFNQGRMTRFDRSMVAEDKPLIYILPLLANRSTILIATLEPRIIHYVLISAHTVFCYRYHKFPWSSICKLHHKDSQLFYLGRKEKRRMTIIRALSRTTCTFIVQLHINQLGLSPSCHTDKISHILGQGSPW